MNIPRLLVVDDERRMVDSLKSLLTKQGYKVETAYDGSEAAEKISQNSYDLIISDIKLPNKNGLELLSLAQKKDPDAVVILMTGYASLESAVDAIGQGAYDYLLKPVEYPHLKMAVSRGLDKHFSNQARDELLEQLKRQNAELNRRIAELNALYRAGHSLSSTIELRELLEQIITIATGVIGAKAGSVMLIDTDINHLKIKASIGIDHDLASKVSLPLGSSIAGTVAQSGEPVMIDDIEKDPEFKRKAKTTYESKSVLSVPLIIKGEVIGVINLTDKHGDEKFSEHDLKLLTTLASQAAIAIDDARHFEEASRKLREFVALYEIASELPNMDDFQQMARLVHFHIRNIMPVDMTLWLSHDQSRNSLTFNFWEGWGNEHFERVEHEEIPITGEQLEKHNIRAEIVLGFLDKNLPVDGKIRAFRAVPIYAKGSFYGLFCMGSLKQASFNVDHEYLASIVTSQAASLYERQRAMLNATQLMTMGNMVSEISHDLRKPLTNVKGALQILKNRTEESKENNEIFDMTQQELSRLSELVRELVDFSNPKKYQTEKQRVEEALDRALKLVSHDLEKSKIELEINLEPNLPLVSLNFNQIIEVFLNIFINAIDAMGSEGKLTVSAIRHTEPKTGKQYVQIQIGDTGEGIAPEDVQRIYDRYFTTKPTGTGLGLAVVERIIMAHNGYLDVASRKGEGTTFYINLPITS